MNNDIESKERKMPNCETSLTLTVKEAAKLSQIGIKEIYWQVKNNPKFPCFHIGKKTLIPRELFEKWVISLAKCD